MAELGFSISNIVDAISVNVDCALNSINDNVAIYSENIEQGFDAPCVYIKLISHDQNKLINQRWIRRYHFDVQYFPDSENARVAEMENVADILVPILGDISNGYYKYHGEKISTEIVDDVLHIFVTYFVSVYQQQTPIDKMATIELSQEEKL
jgi:hypothetical protein